MSLKNIRQTIFAFVFLLVGFLFVFKATAWASDGLIYKWGYMLGGSGTDFGYVYAGPDSSVYILGGYSTTVDFDPTTTVENHSSNGNYDMFLSKYTSDGVYVWTKTWGGTSQDTAYEIFWDSSQNFYVYGEYDSASVDFNPDPVATDIKTGQAGDVFVTKYNSDGTYAWTKTWGGTGADRATAVKVDSSGNYYLTGAFRNTVDFNTDSIATDNKSSHGNYDSFLTKYNSDWSYAWTKTWGGSSYDYAERVVTDQNGNIYVTGDFSNTVNFDTSGGTDNKTSLGQYDCYLTKYSTDGTYNWVKVWGSTGDDMCVGMVSDSSNNLYVSGYADAYASATTIDLDPGSGTDIRNLPGNGDAMVSKFDSDGNYVWGKVFGLTDFDFATSLAIDADNYLYIAGDFALTVDFDTGSSTNNITGNGADVFLSKFDLSGNYIWTKQFSGAGSDWITYKGLDIVGDSMYIALNPGGNINLNPDDSTLTTNFAGEGEVTIAKLTIDNTAPTSNTISLNSGNAYINSLSSTLALSSTGASFMMISEDSGFSGATWETYTTSKSFNLSSGNGTKTVYAKFKDEAGNISSSVSDTIILDQTPPTSGDLILPNNYTKDDNRPTLSFKKSADSLSGVSSYSVSLDSGKNKNYSTSGIPSSGDTTKSSFIWKDDENVKIEFFNENDSDTSNDEIKVYFKGMNKSELTEGKHSWKVTSYDTSGNSAGRTQDFYLDRTNPAISDLSIAGLYQVDKDGVYVIKDSLRLPAFSGKAYDRYQGSEKTNDDGSKDKFDKVSSGPDKITLTIKKIIDQDNNKYENFLAQDYILDNVKDDGDFEKSQRFYIKIPYALKNGYYSVSVLLKDKAGNIFEHSTFYMSLNYKQKTTFQKQTENVFKNMKEKITNAVTGKKKKMTGMPKALVKPNFIQLINSWLGNFSKNIFH